MPVLVVAALLAQDDDAPAYRWDATFPAAEVAASLPSLHGKVAVTAAGEVLVTSDDPDGDAVLVLSPDGRRVRSFGAELAGGVHGLALVGDEVWLAHLDGRVVRTTLDGELTAELRWPEASGLYDDRSQYHPTAVAVASDGSVFVADGYGRSWIHRYDADGTWREAIGGPGRERGRLRNPHGLAVARRGGREVLLVCDRENERVQVLGLDGTPLAVWAEGLRRPADVAVRGELAAVADIDGKVTLLGPDGRPVAHLGENPDPEGRDRKDVPRAAQRAGTFVSPHGVAWGPDGALYVTEWLAEGRVARLLPEAPAGGEDGGAAEDDAPVLGDGALRFRWDPAWPSPEARAALATTHGCVAVDGEGRVYVETDGEDAVLVLSPEGALLDAWGADLAGGLHGLAVVEEEGGTRLYLAHHARHGIAKATPAGEVLWMRGWPEESGLYASESEYRPTSIAVAPDGTIVVADGYGKGYVHRFDRERRWLGAFGGEGTEPGRFRTPHGLWIDAAGPEPVVLVADRENGRLQRFDVEGRLLGTLDVPLRRPSHVQPAEGMLVVPDLEGGVGLLTPEGELLAHLGANADPALRGRFDAPPETWRPGTFVAPHCAHLDPRGNLYVVDWSAAGRVTRLVRVP